MLITIQELKTYTLQAQDGEIGQISEIYFTEDDWHVQYFVINVGNWLADYRVLLTSDSITHIDTEAQTVTVEQTKQEIKDSPNIYTKPTVSEQKRPNITMSMLPTWRFGLESKLYPLIPPNTVLEKYQQEDDNEEQAEESVLRSSNEVIGYDIQATDGSLGQLADLVIDDKTWVVRYVVLDVGGWLSQHKVLLLPDWVRQLTWVDNTVSVGLNQWAIRNAPNYDAEQIIGTDYHNHLLLDLIQEERELILLGEQIVGQPVIATHTGEEIGRVKAVYLDATLTQITALYLGREGLLSRHKRYIYQTDVINLGKDVVLIPHTSMIHYEKELPDGIKQGINKADLHGRDVTTAGGTSIGRINDIVTDLHGSIKGFSLDPIYVSGPIARKGSVARHTVENIGAVGEPMIVDLVESEEQALAV